MKFWKTGLALSITAAFGLVACDDSSSAGGDDSNRISCEVVSEANPVVIKTNEDGYDAKITFSFDEKNGKMVEKVEFSKKPSVDVCKQFNTDNDFVDVKCDDKSVTATFKDEMDAETYELYTSIQTGACKAVDGKKMEDLVPDNDDKVKSSASDDDDVTSSASDDDDVTSSASDDDDVTSSASDDDVTSSASDDDVTSSASDDDDDTFCEDGETKDFGGVTANCVDGKWDLGDLTKCTTEGEEKVVMGVTLVCKNGKWDTGMPECTEENEGEKFSQQAMGITLDLVCTNGEWEEAPCTDGETRTSHMTIAGEDIALPEKCVDGEWEMDMDTDLVPTPALTTAGN